MAGRSIGTSSSSDIKESEGLPPIVTQFNLYCEGTQPTYIHRAVEEFENVRQKDEEDETAYARQVRSTDKCFGGFYSEADLITRFIRGLDPALKPLLSAELNSELRSCRTFYDVVDRAAGLGDSQRVMVHRATRRQKTTQNLRHRMNRVSSIEPATR